jgi:hypothetical protein
MNSGLSEIALKLEITNRTPEELQIHRDHMQLRPHRARPSNENSWHAGQAMRLASGKGATMSVHFFTPASQSCTDDLELDLQGAVTVRDRPVPLEPIRFVAQSL